MTQQRQRSPVRKESLRKAYPFSVVAGIIATIKMAVIFVICVVFYSLWSQNTITFRLKNHNVRQTASFFF